MVDVGPGSVPGARGGAQARLSLMDTHAATRSTGRHTGVAQRPRRRVAMALLLAIGASGASCSSGGDDAVGDPGGSAAVTETADAATDDLFTRDASPDGEDGAPDPNDLGPVPPPMPTGDVPDSVLDPIDPVPETGVPGIDSDDVFCRSWSEYAGSYQALTFAWALREPQAASRLEVVATDALTAAAAGLADALPPELEAERQALTVELTSPLLRRAERARSLLAAAGVDDAGIEALGDAWLAVLADAGAESEDLIVPIDDPTLDAAVEAAAERLRAEIPPIVEDPSLIVDVQIGATEAYLFENCPDRGILAGNDNVDT